MLTKTTNKIAKNTACLITNPSNIRYLTSFRGSNGAIFLTKNKSFFLTDFRYAETAKKTVPKNFKIVIAKTISEFIKENLPKIKTIKFEEEHLTYNKYRALKKELPKIKIIPQTGLIENLRVTKTPEEIKLITKSQRINEKTLYSVIKKIKPGVTETDLAWEIIKTAKEFGAEDVSFPPIVAFGTKSSRPHRLSGNEKLKKGDLVLIDMGVKYKGYCSDMTRVLFTKTPTARQKEVYNIVLQAQEMAIKTIKPGITGKKIDSISRNYIEKMGFGPNFGHSLGHGVGLDIHERPYLSPKYPKTIPNGAVITVEPGIYLENDFGIRIEDMVLVNGDKVINLTKVPKKIEDLILTI